MSLLDAVWVRNDQVIPLCELSAALVASYHHSCFPLLFFSSLSVSCSYLLLVCPSARRKRPKREKINKVLMNFIITKYWKKSIFSYNRLKLKNIFRDISNFINNLWTNRQHFRMKICPVTENISVVRYKKKLTFFSRKLSSSTWLHFFPHKLSSALAIAAAWASRAKFTASSKFSSTICTDTHRYIKILIYMYRWTSEELQFAIKILPANEIPRTPSVHEDMHYRERCIIALLPLLAMRRRRLLNWSRFFSPCVAVF